MIVKPGSTDVTTYFHLRSTSGGDATALTITDLDLQYTRSGETSAAKVDATALGAANSAHSDNKAIEVDATDQPGVHRVDWPDAAFAAGVREVVLTVKGAAILTESLRVQLQSIPSDVMAIGGSTTAGDNLRASASTIYQGEVDSATATTLVDDGLTQADDDHWKGRIVIFTSGALAKQATIITGFDAAFDELSFEALTDAPGAGDTYVIV